MPTKRTRTLIIAALLLYFFANQTQVGWLYVMAALMLGIVLASWLLNRSMLTGITGERHLSLEEIYEGDSLEITLNLHNTHQTAGAQIRTAEVCPLADPETPEHQIEVFLPILPGHQSTSMTYSVPAYRRGLQSFSALDVTTQAPFGIFRTRRKIEITTRVLVYPEVRKLNRLALIDRQPAAQQSRPRAGLGSEVIGVRPFRPGDSPRHVHWRSVARMQHLMSKEFADEAHPGVTLVLDLFQHPYSPSTTKHTPFEWSIKAAASIAEYAYRRGYPLHVVADSTMLPPPPGPVSWSGLMQYLGRIEPIGTQPLSEIIPAQSYQTYVVVLIPWPDDWLIEPLLGLKYRGLDIEAVVVDPASFPTNGPSAESLIDSLVGAGIDGTLIRFGKDWAEQISGTDQRSKIAV